MELMNLNKFCFHKTCSKDLRHLRTSNSQSGSALGDLGGSLPSILTHLVFTTGVFLGLSLCLWVQTHY
jgi:hypothetical protein